MWVIPNFSRQILSTYFSKSFFSENHHQPPDIQASCSMQARINPNMAIYDRWRADDGYSIQGEELGIDVADWPPPCDNKFLTLRLEELTHHAVNLRIEARTRNLARLSEAKQRTDIAHLEVHYTCCGDKIQRDALEALLNSNQRKWLSFTLQGINGISDFYARSASLEDLNSLFLALRTVEVLNLHSCILGRGHGLEAILKTIPLLLNLRELRLQGWQMDTVSVLSLLEGLQEQDSKAVTLLSLRSCSFMGEDTFSQVVSGFGSISQLRTLNLSYCNLGDTDIIPLVQSLKEHPSLEYLHIGGNHCVSPDSVDAIAGWINKDSCKLRDLNLRALWIGYSEEGLLQRLVDLTMIFESLRKNKSLQSLILSENYLENEEVSKLAKALQRKDTLSHLDLGDNPFTEKGAETIFRLVCACSLLESVRFENHFMVYRCAEAIKTQSRSNYVDRRLGNNAINTPLAVWPRILSHVQECDGERFYSNEGSPDIIFHLLRSTTGKFGLPLSYRLGIQYKQP
jgi:hypothetical protein